MDRENQRFLVQLEDGSISEAELLTIVNIDNKNYAVYTIDNKNGTIDILASYVLKDEDNYDKLVDIDSEEDRIKIGNYIKTMI